MDERYSSSRLVSNVSACQLPGLGETKERKSVFKPRARLHSTCSAVVSSSKSAASEHATHRQSFPAEAGVARETRGARDTYKFHCFNLC